MKKLLLLLAVMLPIVVFAQDHIKILGHCVDEPNFKDALIKEGKIKVEDGSYVGEFGGYTSVFLFLPNDNGHIYGIKITKPKYERWPDLKRTYNSYKELFSQKYILDKHIENTGIRYDSSLSENEFALHNIVIGDGMYSSMFIIPNGTIILSIQPKEGSKYPELGEVVIYYIDNKYYAEKQQKDNSKQLDDI